MSVFIIAEAGVNHNGHLSEAMELALAAKQAGADAVKFQHFNSQRLWGDERIRHLELTDAEMGVLARHCAEIGIEFMATPFGVEEVAVLLPLVKRWKIASGCLEKWALLDAIKATDMPIILSTGMADRARIFEAVDRLGMPLYHLTLLQCTSAYPCRVEDANLAAMDRLKEWYPVPVGFSDHTPGITVAIAAAARGATVLEKHLTLDRNAEGPDHKASIEPREFRIMVDAARTIGAALGDGVKRARACEEPVRRQWYGD